MIQPNDELKKFMYEERYFVLDKNDNPIPANIIEWGKMFENHDLRRVAIDKFDVDGEEITVSTVFLGLDHSFNPEPHLPVLWETMIFGGVNSEWMDRYTSKKDALAGHQKAVQLAKENKKDEPLN